MRSGQRPAAIVEEVRTFREAVREVRVISLTDHVDKQSYGHTYEGNQQTPGHPWPTMLDRVGSGNKCKRKGRKDY